MSWTVTASNLLVDEPEAISYLAAVETADGQALESGVRLAVNAFVKGCKADGIWPAIKASCILAGARTLNGALVPLVGTAPTNVNFASGDYNRKTGLVGNGSGGVGTKYLNSNRAGNTDPQNNCHVSAYVSTVGTFVMIGSGDSIGRTSLGESAIRIRSNTAVTTGGTVTSGTFTGCSRSISATATRRVNGTSFAESNASETPASANYTIFARNTGSGRDSYASHRLAFYSIGESLDLALLDARVTTLITAFGTAIA